MTSPFRFVSVSTCLGALSVASAIALWWFVTARGWVSPEMLASPAQVLAALGEILREGYRGMSPPRSAAASLDSHWRCSPAYRWAC
jgi:ABC-type nitrate/sulfonate/bicarbonate transport system permease component